MSQPKNLIEPVEVRTPADALLEATLPTPQGHRDGTAQRAHELLEKDPAAARADIWVAAATGELETVGRLLRENPSLANTRGGTRQWEPLLYLCFSRLLREGGERAGRMLECARRLLDHGADPNACWIDPGEAQGNRETPLYGAAGIANYPDLVKLLIEAGADPNDGETAYHLAEHDGVPSAEYIVPRLEPLHSGAALGHKLDYDDLPGLRKLLELGADPNGPTPFKNLPIHQAVWRGRSRAFFEVLIEFGADVNAPNRDGKTAYTLAARTGRRDILSWLLEMGASTEMSLTDRFLACCALADLAAAQALMAEHPNLFPGLSGVDRATICEAAAAGNTEGVQTMLELGWDVNTRGNVWGETPLHRAALDGHLETARLLYERGADLTIRDRSYSSSPLGWALHSGHQEVARLLGSDPSRLDLRDALECGHQERVLELLGDRDVNAPLAGAEPGIILRAAAAGGHVALVQNLLQRGADPHLVNRDGVSALDLARERSHQEIVALLEAATGTIESN